MNCIVRHKDADLSFQMRCVAVESERVFGEVVVTEQNSRLTTPRGENVSPDFKREARNQAHKVLEAPDFMAMNMRRVIRHRRSAPELETKKRQESESRRLRNSEKDISNAKVFEERKRRKTYPAPLAQVTNDRGVVVSSLVDQLLLDIYGLPGGDRGRSESESTVSSPRLPPQHCNLQRRRLMRKNLSELEILIGTLSEHVNQAGGLLIRQLRRRDHLVAKRDKQYDVITAHLQARSEKRSEDTKMKFSVAPQPGESGFTQWLDAMKMVARLPGGIPPEFRKRLWLTLSERHLQQRGIDWRQAEKLCFNEWSNPDDEELGIQIVKDLHRTGCSLFCGAAGRDNQAVLRRVLLGFARWNKSVGYCQGLNVLAALVLQVMDRAEAASVKVMIYLIEGVLPEGYFADNLRGLSVDMAVFRDLLKIRLPKLSRHLEALQNDAKDKATGSSYEPPLTNVFTMQWFLTLFCHCLPQEAVLRVWDLIFLEGDEVLLRTALAIWEGLADRIMTVTSADEFYSIMGVLTREMLEFTDTNSLIKAIVGTGPLVGVTALREKHRYNITPWVRRLSDDDETETEEDERLAVAAAMFGMSQRGKKERESASSSSLQTVATSNDRERLALDISTLKQQYAKLRERQRQAHIILSAACARQSLVPSATSQAMNHLLVGKSALVSGKARQLGPPPGPAPPRTRLGPPHSPRNPSRKDKQGVTLHWKDTKRRKDSKSEVSGEESRSDSAASTPADEMPDVTPSSQRPGAETVDSDSDSTSTELCDEPDRLSDVDSEELTSTSDCYVIATDDEKSPRRESPLRTTETEERQSPLGSREPNAETAATEGLSEFGAPSLDGTSSTLISAITDQIRSLSVDSEMVNFLENRGAPVGESSAIIVDDKPAPDKKSPKILDEYDFFFNPGNASTLASSEKEAATVADDFGKSNSQFDFKDELRNADSDSPLDKIQSKNLFEFSSELSSSTDFDKSLAISEPNNTLTENFSTELNYSEAKNLKPFSTSYVIGHLPISPISLEQRLNYASDYLEKDKQQQQQQQQETQRSRANGVIVNISGVVDDGESVDATRQKQVPIVMPRLEEIQSPRTPGSEKSSSSGETMGPDSKTSSVTASPRTPISLDFQAADKSAGSSVSSDSKTLTLRSIGSEDRNEGKSKLETKLVPLGKSSSPSLQMSFDSLKSKSSNLSPKLEASSSSDSCSPDRKKSSEVSFSSDLQSPISANSIKFTSNCKNGRGTFSDSPANPCSATSPFYPIARPNEKTPSPYNGAKQKSSATDSEETSPEQRSSSSKSSSAKLAVFESRTSRSDAVEEGSEPRKEGVKEDFHFSLTEDKSSVNELVKRRSEEEDTASFYGVEYTQRYRMETTKFEDKELSDRYGEKDTLSPLPREKFEKRGGVFSDKSRSLIERSRERSSSEEERGIVKDYSKPFERSSSNLDKRFTDLKVSLSGDEFGGNNLKKRSSDILEDLRHLEVKTLGDGSSDNGTLTKKTSDILEDLKSLEARRQDTFSDSASGFSKGRLGDLDTSLPIIPRKQYVIEPKIKIQEDSESFLNTLARVSEGSDAGDDKEPKIGVWTKVRPRKKSDNGRRSSDRALKIIQENSAILQRILTCQAKKRLPDLEEISKEITISPINEEISKIFSPILEKIGLNEHEINEELARINFKDFDQLSVTSGSEFDAKINDELSKLSLIDDCEEIDHLDLDEALSRDYLDTREALIDRQINEELSKLLANYEDRPSSSGGLMRQEKCSSSQNVSELEGLDLSSISTNVFSHKSSSDSIETKSELGSVQEALIKSEKCYDYGNCKPIPYPPPKYNLQDISPKSDIDIYRELEKLDKISAGEIYPSLRTAEVPSPNSYGPESLSFSERISSPILSYATKSEKSFDSSPLRSPYDSYKPYDFKSSRISPRKTPSNPYSVRSYEKPGIGNSSFDFTDTMQKSTASSHIYDLSPKRPVLSKETLEFRVRYDDEPSQNARSTGDDFSLRPFQSDILDLNKGAAYYDAGCTVESAKYLSREERSSEIEIGDPSLDYKYNKSELYHRKYQDLSPKEYSYHQTPDYNRSSSYIMPSPIREDEVGGHLSVRRRESHSLSPSHQFTSRKLLIPVNAYLTKLSPSLEDVTKRPVSHPEFLDKMNAAKYADHSSQGSNNYRKSSLSLGNIGHASRGVNRSLEKTTPSPKSQFSPFPVRNTARKPTELGLKLGLYSPTSPGSGQLKRTH